MLYCLLYVVYGLVGILYVKSFIRLGPNGSAIHGVDNNAMESMRSGIPGIGLGLRDKDHRFGGETSSASNVVGRYHEMYEQKMNPFEEVSYARGYATVLYCTALYCIRIYP